MDEDHPLTIEPADLAARLGTAAAPVVLDVRRAPAFAAAETMIVGALSRDPAEIETWAGAFVATVPADRPVAVYCLHGHEASRDAAARLRRAGVDARVLAGGIEAWIEAGLPTRRKLAAGPAWVTRARPKIDRIACPWLVRRFVDPEATFLYVPADRVMAVAAETGATAYDVPNVAFTHEGGLCSFDAFLKLYGIADPALDHLAAIVRGADTGRFELAPQAAGLLAVSLGLSALIADDLALLDQGMVLYDALYTWCRALTGETHSWPPAMVA